MDEEKFLSCVLLLFYDTRGSPQQLTTGGEIQAEK
jgi:hypothetical protein